MSFNASDPSGAGGVAGDVATIAAMGAHALPVVTSIVMRDTAEVFDHHAIDADVIVEQARSVLEDVTIAAWKVGFLGSTEGVSAVAEILSDYPDVPLVAYLPNLSWVEEDEQQAYLDAFRDLVLPQTEVLVGSHQTLRRLPAARLGRRAAGLAARAGGRRQQARHALRARHQRSAARPVPRQRAGLAAGRDHRREVRALRGRASSAPATRCRPRSPRCSRPASSCTPRSARRSPSSTRRSTPASAPAWATSIPDRFFWALPPTARKRRDGDDVPAAADDDAGAAEEPAPCPLTPRGAADATANARAVRARPARHPGRRQLAGARLPRRRRHAALHRPRRRRRHLRRRRQALHRLHRLVGADDPRPRPPGGAGAVHAAVDDGLSFGAPTEREIELAEAILEPRAEHRAGAPGQLGHRGGDERAAPGARRRPAATSSSSSRAATTAMPTRCWSRPGSGLATFGHPTSAGVPGRGGPAHAGARVQRRRRSSRRRSRCTATTIACVMIEPIAGNMNFVRADVPFMQRLRELCTAARRAARLRRGDDRLSRRARRRAEPLRARRSPASRPTSACSAR